MHNDGFHPDSGHAAAFASTIQAHVTKTAASATRHAGSDTAHSISPAT